MKELPWSPIYTVYRDGVEEVTIYGVVSIVSRSHRLLTAGDTTSLLWTRSLLKPWQLLCNLPILKESFPELTHEHFAIMMASHSGQPHQVRILREVMRITGLSERDLRCPAAYPLGEYERCRMIAAGAQPSRILNCCSGKHLAYLAALKASGFGGADYLNPRADQLLLLKEIIVWLTGTAAEELPQTTDGCLLPNLGLSADNMARLYLLLANELPGTVVASNPALAARLAGLWDLLRLIMSEHPLVIGGNGRLDSRIMMGEVTGGNGLRLIAKEGADGLLGIGIGACNRYPSGLGVLLKLASGHGAHHLEVIAPEIFRRLDLKVSSSVPVPDSHNVTFHLPALESGVSRQVR